ncbi:TniQ family protein [Stenotrophomonas maltophilia]|uniref:TniQ family protein n=1 Tax=Stenotrophomonas maltophilia TaxID=40324 RepID=UPI0015F210C1|nr:TniQ family protein [Stenotrophomonas maltophilia]QDY47164.1 hypothetical protein DUW70_00720 [Stenotrophomonas maltophilia]
MTTAHMRYRWTALPPIAPIDGATAQTESLGGYFQRMCETTGFTKTHLAGVLDKVAGQPRNGLSERNSFVGPGQVSLNRARALEQLTNQRLVGCTLSPFINVLQMRDGGLAGINRRWCPECLLEAGESNGLSERLIWNFLHYSHCSLHSVRIIDRCQECGNSQQLRRGNAASCAYCGCSLARATTHERPSALQSWANASIEDVVRWTATNPDVVIPAENYQRFFDGLLQDGTLDRLKIVHNRFWRDAIRFRRTTTTFRTLLNLSAIKSVDIIGILTEPVPASSTSLFPSHEVDGEIAFDLEDWGAQARKFEVVLHALCKANTRVFPSQQFLSLLLVSKRKSSIHRAPSFSVYLDIQRQPGQDLLAGRNMASRIMALSMTLLKSGMRERGVASEVLKRFAISAEIARECARTAVVITKAMRSPAFRASGDPFPCR